MSFAGNHPNLWQHPFDLAPLSGECEHPSQNLEFAVHRRDFHTHILTAPGVPGDFLGGNGI
jgi:hypothetical protein